ncbi:MAG: ECF-type sigma factor [Planctomycetota bacterium]|jgi:RNA polymerase sigma factor (TIGR02999 family)
MLDGGEEMLERGEEPADERITALLAALGSGDRKVAGDLLPLVYEELRRLARSRLARLAPGQTLQATALVHEAYLRLVGRDDPAWDGRGHFFGAAARAMRDILVEQARRKSRRRHGGDRRRVSTEEAEGEIPIECDLDSEELLALDGAIERLREQHPRAAEVTMLRYFAGLSAPVAADVLQVSVRTVERDWRFARAWLHREVSESAGNGAGPETAPS